MTAPREERNRGRMAEPTDPDDPAVTVAITKMLQISSVAKTGIYGVAVPVSIWATQPIAAALAGKTTTLNVTVAVTVAISLTITNAGTYAWGRHHKKRADQAEQRAGKLEKDLRAATKRQPKRKPK